MEEVKDEKKKSRKRQLKDHESSSESDEVIEGVEHLTGLGKDKNGKWCVNITNYQDLYDNATKRQKKQLDRKFNRGTDQSGKIHFYEKPDRKIFDGYNIAKNDKHKKRVDQREEIISQKQRNKK